MLVQELRHPPSTAPQSSETGYPTACEMTEPWEDCRMKANLCPGPLVRSKTVAVARCSRESGDDLAETFSPGNSGLGAIHQVSGVYSLRILLLSQISVSA